MTNQDHREAKPEPLVFMSTIPLDEAEVELWKHVVEMANARLALLHERRCSPLISNEEGK